MNTSGPFPLFGKLFEVSTSHHRTLPLLLKMTCFLLEFMEANPDLVAKDNALDFLSDDGGLTYNRCHCESVAPFIKTCCNPLVSLE